LAGQTEVDCSNYQANDDQRAAEQGDLVSAFLAHSKSFTLTP
jgi:hypothetical protein